MELLGDSMGSLLIAVRAAGPWISIGLVALLSSVYVL